MSECYECKLVAMGKGRSAMCYDCLEERNVELEQQLAELKKAYNERISQSQDQILELQAELAEQERLAAPLTKALYKEMSERHAAISVQLAELQKQGAKNET